MHHARSLKLFPVELITYLGMYYDTDRTVSVPNRSKKVVNVVNMVNVADHVLSYDTPNPAGQNRQ